jgi:hypothetical protein
MPRIGLTNRRRSGYRENDLLFGTWNVRTLFKSGALISLLSQLKKYKLGITALQETRWQGKGIIDMKRNVLDCKAGDERMCALRIKTKFQNVSFINVHAPTEEKEEIEKEVFYHKMEEVYEACPPPPTDIKILLGDLNATIGREEMYQGIIGRYSMHLNTNNNGQMLVDLAAAKNMVIFSTCFPHKEIHKQTWRSPDRKTNNQFNQIFTDKGMHVAY